MKKRMLFSMCLLAFTLMATGCPYFTNAAHTRAHSRAIDNDMVEIHQFMDRHFWSYDWQDPYAY